MEDLLRQIDETFDTCINTSSEETALQLKIIKGNIHTIVNNYTGEIKKEEKIEEQPAIEAPVTVPVEEVKETFDKTLLIVDDSSIVRNYLKKIFEGKYNILLATDGKEAIDVLNENSDINVILLDLLMPNIDGFGVLEYINGKGITAPVVVISGDNSSDTIQKTFQYNVVDMIEKPFDSKKIEDKISHIIG